MNRTNQTVYQVNSWYCMDVKDIYFYYYNLKGTQAVRIELFAYIRSCQYSMFYRNKKF